MTIVATRGIVAGSGHPEEYPWIFWEGTRIKPIEESLLPVEKPEAENYPEISPNKLHDRDYLIHRSGGFFETGSG